MVGVEDYNELRSNSIAHEVRVERLVRDLNDRTLALRIVTALSIVAVVVAIKGAL